MCRKLALLATVLAMTSFHAALAGEAEGVKPVYAALPQQTQPAVAPAPVPATAQQRAEAQRMDPLARAAFWGREFEIDGRDAVAGVNLAQALRALGRYADAASTAQQVLVISPTNQEALLETARAFIGQNQGFYAIEPVRKAMAQAPRDWRPVSLLAVALEQASRDDEALAAHRQALALAPDEPAVLSNMGLFLASHGDLPQAEALLRRACAGPRATIQIRQNLALVIGLQGRIGEAEKLVRQDLPPETVNNNLAWLKAAVGNAPQSRNWEAVRGPGGS